MHRNCSKPQCAAIAANRNAPQLQQAAMRGDRTDATECRARHLMPQLRFCNCGDCGDAPQLQQVWSPRTRAQASKRAVIAMRARAARSSDAHLPAISRNRQSPVAAISRNKAHYVRATRAAPRRNRQQAAIGGDCTKGAIERKQSDGDADSRACAAARAQGCHKQAQKRARAERARTRLRLIAAYCAYGDTCTHGRSVRACVYVHAATATTAISRNKPQ